MTFSLFLFLKHCLFISFDHLQVMYIEQRKIYCLVKHNTHFLYFEQKRQSSLTVSSVQCYDQEFNQT